MFGRKPDIKTMDTLTIQKIFKKKEIKPHFKNKNKKAESFVIYVDDDTFKWSSSLFNIRYRDIKKLQQDLKEIQATLEDLQNLNQFVCLNVIIEMFEHVYQQAQYAEMELTNEYKACIKPVRI